MLATLLSIAAPVTVSSAAADPLAADPGDGVVDDVTSPADGTGAPVPFFCPTDIVNFETDNSLWTGVGVVDSIYAPSGTSAFRLSGTVNRYTEYFAVDLSGGGKIEFDARAVDMELDDSLQLEYSTDGTTWTLAEYWATPLGLSNTFSERLVGEIPETDLDIRVRLTVVGDAGDTVYVDNICVSPKDGTTIEPAPACFGVLDTFETGYGYWQGELMSSDDAPRGANAAPVDATVTLDFGALDMSGGATVEASVYVDWRFSDGTLALEYSVDGTSWRTAAKWDGDDDLVAGAVTRISAAVPETGVPTEIRFTQGSSFAFLLDDLCVVEGLAVEPAPSCAATLETFEDDAGSWTTPDGTDRRARSVSPRGTWSLRLNSSFLESEPKTSSPVDLTSGGTLALSVYSFGLTGSNDLTLETSIDGTFWVPAETWTDTSGLENRAAVRLMAELPAIGPDAQVRLVFDATGIGEAVFLDDICLVDATTPSAGNAIQATVTCLAGNGRVEVNLVHGGYAPALYELHVGSLSPRSSMVNPKSFWRSPITGRPDGPLQVTLTRWGGVVFDAEVNVACDADYAVTDPNVDVLTWCIGGNGMVWAQFTNPTASSQVYILDVNGLRRSTTAAAYGAAFRGVSGRPNGDYNVEVEVGGAVVYTETVTVDC